MADELLEMALATWGARLVANGVDAGDLAEVARTLDRWDDWCAAWSRIGARHEELGRRALAEDRTRSGGEHLAEAATSYHFGRFLFLEHPDEARTAHRRAVRCLVDALPHLDPPGRREVVPFEGTQLFGVLRLPPGGGLHPVVVLVCGLDSTKEELRLVERSFLDRGVGTFAVDGPGQGEVEQTLPIRADWEVPGRAILDHLSTLPGVDAERLGVWGVSLGGYYAARVAAGDERVRACVALAGPYDLGAAWDKVPSLTRRAFAARAHSSDEREAREKARAISLAGVAPRIRCPLLVVFGKKDRLFAWQDAVRLAHEASGPSELLLLEEGNHGCANVTYRHRPYTADWMARRLGAWPGER